MKNVYTPPPELARSAKHIDTIRSSMLIYGTAMAFLIEECEDHRKVDNKGKNGCGCKKCALIRHAKELGMV